MNAVMRKCDMAEGVPVADSENDRLGIQVAELRSDVRHIKDNVTDIKADLRATQVRFDNLDQKVDLLRERTEQRFESFRKDIDARFDKAAKDVAERFDKVDQRFDKHDAKFDSMRKDIGDIKQGLAAAKVWAVLLYAGLAATLLGVMAHGFKWI